MRSSIFLPSIMLNVADHNAFPGGTRRTLTSGKFLPSNGRITPAALLQKSQLSLFCFQSIARCI
jgi:hypothetical protein